MASLPKPELTTAGLQKYLDENHFLLQAIKDNQSEGNTDACVHYSVRLARNYALMAPIFDSRGPTTVEDESEVFDEDTGIVPRVLAGNTLEASTFVQEAHQRRLLGSLRQQILANSASPNRAPLGPRDRR
eukprot:TRINITY_DN8590_c0_g1_i1.p2 TRINITY_DN8590_c0_g1~~TRINITY_DN8590_c0_g1_i1.p2  ORF type:complete len:130 (-),score=4.05 TRINITY_DN8590_c0_g1_i1:211-600(-)